MWATNRNERSTVMSHHELYARSVMDDRMREARAARRASEARARRHQRSDRIGQGIIALISRMVLR